MGKNRVWSILPAGLLILSLFSAHFRVAPAVAQAPPVAKGVAWLPELKWKNADGSFNWRGIESDLQDIQNAGITWVRVIFNEKESPTYFANLVPRVRAHNISILVRVMKSYPAKDLGTLAQQANYRAWLANIVSTYRNDIRYWEIQNETNLAKYWSIDHDPNSDPVLYAQSVQNYLRHLENSYATIKAVDPSLQVLIGGISEWRMGRYMDELIRQHAHRFFDILAYHPYAPNPDLAMGRMNEFGAKIAEDPDLANKPIWITEVGFHTETTWRYGAPGWVPDEETKADYLLQTMQRLQAMPGVASPLFWFNFSEASSSISGFGLVRKDKATLQTTYLPAYSAWKDLWVTRFVAILTPVADSYVSSASPSSNYGLNNYMRVNTSSQATEVAYLRFDTSAYAGATLYKTRLKIQTVNQPISGSTSRQRVRISYDAVWGERTLTYNDRPKLNRISIGSISNTTAPTWYYIWLNYEPIQKLLGQAITLGLTSDGSDDIVFHSKESATPPQLILYYTR